MTPYRSNGMTFNKHFVILILIRFQFMVNCCKIDHFLLLYKRLLIVIYLDVTPSKEGENRLVRKVKQQNKTTSAQKFSIKQTSNLSYMYAYNNLTLVATFLSGSPWSLLNSFQDFAHVLCLSGFSWIRFRKSFLPASLEQHRYWVGDSSSADNSRVSCRQAERLPGRGVRADCLHSIELVCPVSGVRPCTLLGRELTKDKR